MVPGEDFENITVHRGLEFKISSKRQIIALGIGQRFLKGMDTQGEPDGDLDVVFINGNGLGRYLGVILYRFICFGI
jgi:hypothetical protein